MYRRLEEKVPALKATESTGSAECVCTCNTAVSKSEEKTPAAIQAGVDAGVYYEIHGKMPG